MQSLSVIVITKNEANNIEKCLESVKWANEIIVLDSGSTDETVNLCRKYTGQVYETDWPGYGVQKNRALAKATCDWVLSIDADEIVSLKLQKEIQRLLTDTPKHSAYTVLRLSKYCRKYLRYGDWKNDRCLRLFKRTVGCFKEVAVHEKLLVQGTIGELNAILYHHSFNHLEQVLNKLNEYSTLGASLNFDRNNSSSLTKAIFHGVWTFIRSYFLKLGFLDGREGFIMAVSNAEGCYYRYLKLLYLHEAANAIKKSDAADIA